MCRTTFAGLAGILLAAAAALLAGYFLRAHFGPEPPAKPQRDEPQGPRDLPNQKLGREKMPPSNVPRP